MDNNQSAILMNGTLPEEHSASVVDLPEEQQGASPEDQQGVATLLSACRSLRVFCRTSFLFVDCLQTASLFLRTTL